jgi:hypothetical protein
MLDSCNPETPAFEPHLATVYSAVFSSQRAHAVEGVEFQNGGPRFLCYCSPGQEGLSFGFNLDEMAFLSVLCSSVIGQVYNTGHYFLGKLLS